MNKTGESSLMVIDRLLLTTPELQSFLGCGYCSAVKIGNAARAKIRVGKRVLWYRQKIEVYLNNISE